MTTKEIQPMLFQFSVNNTGPTLLYWESHAIPHCSNFISSESIAVQGQTKEKQGSVHCAYTNKSEIPALHAESIYSISSNSYSSGS